MLAGQDLAPAPCLSSLEEDVIFPGGFPETSFLFLLCQFFESTERDGFFDALLFRLHSDVGYDTPEELDRIFQKVFVSHRQNRKRLAQPGLDVGAPAHDPLEDGFVRDEREVIRCH